MKKIVNIILISLFSIFFFYSYSKDKRQEEPVNLSIFRAAYPMVTFNASYDESVEDYLIDIKVQDYEDKRVIREGQLYWCESRLLPMEKVAVADKYRKMLYLYPEELKEPSEYSKLDIKRIKEFTSEENRKNGAIEPPFLYDIIYDTTDRVHIESHIKKLSFLGKGVNLNETLKEALARVEEKVKYLAESGKEEEREGLREFLKTLNKVDGFNYRTVRDTQSRSFHCTGHAIDILPKGYYKKNIYWLWRKQNVGEEWYLTPLEDRWSPPICVIKAFEEEGFIWGGKWIVWDNMHFEYRPEIIVYNRRKWERKLDPSSKTTKEAQEEQ